MKSIIIAAKSAAILSGAAILYIVADASIVSKEASGADARIIFALAGGIFIASATLGIAISERRRGLVAFLMIAGISAEAYNLTMTADRQIKIAEGSQAGERKQLATLADAKALIERLETSKASSPGLDSAERAAREADAKVDAERKNVRCGNECQRLQTIANDRWADVAKAAKDAEQARQAQLTAAQDALAALPPILSGSATADRIGIPAWAYDLIQAALLSIGLNGLAAGLIAFGTHGGSHQAREEDAKPLAPAKPSPSEIPDDFDFEDYRRRFVEGPQGGSGEGSNVIRLPFRAGVEMVPPERSMTRKERKAMIVADILARKARGDQFESQEELRAILIDKHGHISRAALSVWLSELDDEIERVQEGRRKRI